LGNSFFVFYNRVSFDLYTGSGYVGIFAALISGKGMTGKSRRMVETFAGTLLTGAALKLIMQ
jgi:hypothetical protein